jgi:hypothetical protein
LVHDRRSGTRKRVVAAFGGRALAPGIRLANPSGEPCACGVLLRSSQSKKVQTFSGSGPVQTPAKRVEAPVYVKIIHCVRTSASKILQNKNSIIRALEPSLCGAYLPCAGRLGRGNFVWLPWCAPLRRSNSSGGRYYRQKEQSSRRLRNLVHCCAVVI